MADVGAGPLARLYARLVDRLDEATVAPRRRHAESVFWTKTSARRDRLASDLYFELSAALWGRRAFDQAHLAPFDAALGRCPPARRAADLGTGAGASAWRLAERYPECQVVGIDGSRAMLRAARKRFSAPNLRYLRADLRHLPFADGHFELVTALNALPEPDELARVCARGGTFALANTYFRPGGAVTWRYTTSGFSLVLDEPLGDGGYLLFERLAAPRGVAPLPAARGAES